MNKSCVLCVFVFFLQISGHKTNVLHKFLCFFVYKLLLLKSHHPCVLCVFVFLQRSRVTTPMYFVCFCVFLPTLSLILVQTGTPTPCVLCVFVFFSSQVSGHTTHVFCVFLCFFLPTFSLILVQTGATAQCVLCVFVFFFHRFQVTPPMCFVCFCVFFTNAQFDPSSDRCNHPMCFVNKYMCPTQIPEILDQQNVAK